MRDLRDAKLLVMTAGGLNPQVMINALARHYPRLAVIQENYESKGTLLRRRARRLGWPTALGQLATMMLSRLGKRMTARRSDEILRDYRLSGDVNPAIPVTHVASLNDERAHDAIRAFAPDRVFTISCRILAKTTLAAIPCPIVNFHAGINPLYRGQMGGYWARVEGDEANFGATLHLVDAGTDTGATLAEVRTRPSRLDTISTYPLLLTAAGVETTLQVVDDVLKGTAKPFAPEGRSMLRFPPPIWTYLHVGLTRRIW